MLVAQPSTLPLSCGREAAANQHRRPAVISKHFVACRHQCELASVFFFEIQLQCRAYVACVWNVTALLLELRRLVRRPNSTFKTSLCFV